MLSPALLLLALTCVDEPARCPLAELFGFVGQGDFHHTRDVPRGGLHTDGMWGDQLQEERARKLVSLPCGRDPIPALHIYSLHRQERKPAYRSPGSLLLHVP